MWPVRWLVSGLVWADWCWFYVREKYYWLAGLGWLKPTSEQGDARMHMVIFHACMHALQDLAMCSWGPTAYYAWQRCFFRAFSTSILAGLLIARSPVALSCALCTN